MALGRAWQQLQPISMSGQNLTYASNEVPIRRKRPAGEVAFEFLNDTVEALNQFRYVTGRVRHGDRLRWMGQTQLRVSQTSTSDAPQILRSPVRFVRRTLYHGRFEGLHRNEDVDYPDAFERTSNPELGLHGGEPPPPL